MAVAPYNREQFLKEMDGLDSDLRAEPVRPEPDQELNAQADEVEPPEGDETPVEPEVEAKEEVEEEPQIDPRTAKALEVRQKEEKRRKQEHALRISELRELEGEVRRGKAELLSEKQNLEARMASALEDPVGFLKELGASEEMFEEIARQFYFASPKAKADPKLRNVADAQRRRMAVETRLSAAMRKIEEMERRESERIQAAEREQLVSDYVGGVIKAVDEARSPLISQWLKKAPAKVQQKMREKAQDLAANLGYVPEADEVIEALEHDRRSELEELGISVDTVIKTKTPDPISGAKKNRPTLSNDMSASRGNRPPAKNRDDEVADVLQALERGVLD